MKIKKDKIFIILLVCTIALVFSSIFFLKPQIAGDSVSYLKTINFLQTGIKSPDFIPNRIMTTFGALQLVMFFSGIFGSETQVWIVMNVIFYFISTLVFYKLLDLFFEDKKIALLGTLFMISNYAFIRFGLNYLMDIGGWTFYIISLFLLLRYSKSNNRRDLLSASIIVGIGSLFKEYALLGVIPIAVFLIYENRKSFTGLIKNSIIPAVFSSTPIITLYIFVYLKFGYTYADWLTDSYKYSYSSSFILKIAEYIKSFGSLFNFLGIFVITGAYILWKEKNNLNGRTKLFIISAIASFLPVFAWGSITQRILFIMVPVSIIIACFFFKKYKKYYYWFLPVLAIYILINFFMDSFLLNFINLPF